MKTSEIRPHTTYIGPGGLRRKVKTVKMDVAGGLYVEWKAVGLSRKAVNASTWGLEPIRSFARWALAIEDTLSDDLKHHLTGHAGAGGDQPSARPRSA